MAQSKINIPRQGFGSIKSQTLYSLFLKSTGTLVSSDGLVAGIVRRNLYFDQIQTQCELRGILPCLSSNAITYFLQTSQKKHPPNGHLKKIQSP